MDASIAPTYRTELQRILRESGIKQRWLAHQVGMAESRLSQIANGLHCDDATQRKIADALRRKPEEVFPERTAA